VILLVSYQMSIDAYRTTATTGAAAGERHNRHTDLG